MQARTLDCWRAGGFENNFRKQQEWTPDEGAGGLDSCRWRGRWAGLMQVEGQVGWTHAGGGAGGLDSCRWRGRWTGLMLKLDVHVKQEPSARTESTCRAGFDLETQEKLIIIS